jgi:hypothetical protein
LGKGIYCLSCTIHPSGFLYICSGKVTGYQSNFHKCEDQRWLRDPGGDLESLPGVKPDIYHVLKPDSENNITFYTDIDSIFFHVLPGKKYNFIVLLNEKDSCFTQISALEAAKDKAADSGTARVIGPELLAMDFVVFRNYLLSEHPGLYRYKSTERLEMLFDSCLLSIDKPESQLGFARKILFAISEIQDGHTGSNISSLLVKTCVETARLFPLYLYFVDDKAFVSCNNTKELPVGTEILAIDKKPILEIRNQLFKYLPSDGSIETKKMQTLNSNGAFPFLYYWIFGIADSFEIEYKNSRDEIDKIQIPARLAKDFECEIANKPKNAANLYLEYPGDHIALLTVKTFDKNKLGGRDEYFSEFLAKSFLEIKEKQIDNLIIDLRGNAGGEDRYGSLLYSFLASAPFKYYSSVQSTSKVFTKEENPLLGILPQQANHFRGNIVILINGLSFSTTSEFCAIARSNKRATFIGEETGGGYYGNTSGQTIRIELPNSKINVIIPRVQYVNAVKQLRYLDRGVIPDHRIIPAVHDYVAGNDVQLEFALDLIKKSVK